ncbi:flagellar biosynthesis protein FlhB [Dethiobacter alkaliphilus]|uniref:flagellar biosynthesis protein FlhB n=1 Tax=Dethiobacter alkaliphilus TaxID=427926 RepID=UPI002962022C|nr:flagellar biosynthesis protein FlhB [Dethiobacter alkaliphilus]
MHYLSHISLPGTGAGDGVCPDAGGYYPSVQSVLTCRGRLDLQLFAGEGDKTEEATPKRKQEARKKGQVVKSAELNSAVNLLVMTALFMAVGQFLFNHLAQTMMRFLQMDGRLLTPGNLNALTMRAFGDFFLFMAPVFAVSLIAGLAVNYLQVGFLFTTEPLNPQFNRLNPAEGFKKIASKRALFELAKSLLKVLLVGFVAFLFVRGNLENLLATLYQDAAGVWETLRALSLNLALRIAALFLALSVLDYIYQRYEHNQNLKMSKQEIKEEHKQMEGDPQLKSQLRERQRSIATQRMMQDVPEATVVITNPTQLAVAIRYREDRDEAPTVVAKGAALMAKRIRETAKENNVPIMENKPVARMLYDQVEIGQEIPVDLYQAVAEILALVYKLR